MARISRLLAGAGVATLGALRLRRPPQSDSSPEKPFNEEPDPAQPSRPPPVERSARLLSEARYRTPADQVINYAIFMIDRQGRNATWNKGVGRMLGYSMTEFLGHPVAECYTPEDQAADLPAQQLAEAIEHGRTTRERWVVRKDGSRFWASTATTAARDAKGEVIGFAQTLRDLTDLRRAEEELRRSREALEFALEAAALGTWDQDLMTGELRWDSRAKALFGLSPDDVISQRRWANAVRPEDLPGAEAAREQAVRDRTPFSIEYRIVWPDGSEHTIAMVGRATVDLAGGQAVRMAGVMLDITERKRTEARLQEVLRLEAIGRLAGGIAHDLNNMLVAILGFSDLLAGSFQPDDPRREDVEQIALVASRSANLTRQLLAFARREIIQPHRMDINRVVQRAEGMLRPVLGENIELLFQLAPDVGVIYADAGQVEQILMNLVLNARDAMPQGGRVVIETAKLALGGALSGRQVESEASPGRYIMLAVSDTGDGMDPATLQRPDSRPTVREDVSILGDLKKLFDFHQDPLPPLILDPHPDPGPASTPGG